MAGITDQLENIPPKVWFISLGVGGGIGVLILIRNRNKPPAEPDTTPADALNSEQATLQPSPIPFSGDYGGGGLGGSVSATDPAVNIGNGYVPWQSVLDLFQTGIGIGQTQLPQTGGGLPAAPDPTLNAIVPEPLPPPVALPGPAPKPAPAHPPAAPATCPPSHPYANASYKPAPWGCYRVVLIGKQRWHYHYDGRKVRVS